MSSGFTVDALGRRKWDKEFYRKQVEETERARLEAEAQVPKKPTAPLQRDAVVSLDDVHRTQLRSADGLLRCSVCDVTLRDSHAYFDHINGKAHNRALGMTMSVQKASPEDVKNKLLQIRAILYPSYLS